MIKLITINNYPNMLMKTMMTMPAIRTGKRPENAKAAIVRSVFVGTLAKRLVLRRRGDVHGDDKAILDRDGTAALVGKKVRFLFGIEIGEGQ